MEKQKLIVVLLIVAIVISAVNLVISLSLDDVFVPAGSQGGVDSQSQGSTVSLTVGEPGGNS